MDLSHAIWRKSSRSGQNAGNCIEVADKLPGIVGVRDSKHPTGPALTLPPRSWTSLIAAIKRGELDR